MTKKKSVVKLTTEIILESNQNPLSEKHSPDLVVEQRSEGFTGTKGAVKPRSSLDVTDLRSVKSTDDDSDQNITITIQENEQISNGPELGYTPIIKPVLCSDVITDNDSLRKRGRKPKGGKLFSKTAEKNESSQQVANIILHLKCSLQELNKHSNNMDKIVTDPLLYNPIIPPNIMSYNSESSVAFSEYIRNEQTGFSEEKTGIENELVKPAYNDFSLIHNSVQYCSACNDKLEQNLDVDQDEDPTLNMKDINQKLKRLKINLYKNANPDKKSACFWCTYEYDNHACYIPKYEISGEMFGYGSFCRPECAVAYLMKENIDDSTKFERYHLLNQIYSKIYNFKKNIKPAPSPYFLLEKYYGNLSIQEYRKLLKTEHMLLIIDKPMTRILPELHEDNEDFITNIYGSKNNQNSGTGVYKVKKQSDKQKGPGKSTIIKENFGMSFSC